MNKILHKIVVVVATLVITVSVFGILPTTVQAQPPAATPQVNITDISAIHRIVTGLINWAFIFFFTIAIAFILMAAFSYLTAGDKGAEVGKKRIQIAITAIIIALLARGLPALIQSIITPPPAT